VSDYVPEAGDLIWLDPIPQAGHEQAGRRSAVVLSSGVYNRRSRLAIVCPITNHVKGYPFEVPLPKTLPITGVILADHLRGLDWHVRRAEKAGRVSTQVMAEILERVAPLLGLAA
jgi:mRNA interferase MazF